MADDDPAVAESVLVTCFRLRPDIGLAKLSDLARNPEREPFLRALAASLIREKQKPVPVAVLEGICGAGDADATILAADLLSQHPDREAAGEHPWRWPVSPTATPPFEIV